MMVCLYNKVVVRRGKQAESEHRTWKHWMAHRKGSVVWIWGAAGVVWHCLILLCLRRGKLGQRMEVVVSPF